MESKWTLDKLCIKYVDGIILWNFQSLLALLFGQFLLAQALCPANLGCFLPEFLCPPNPCTPLQSGPILVQHFNQICVFNQNKLKEHHCQHKILCTWCQQCQSRALSHKWIRHWSTTMCQYFQEFSSTAAFFIVYSQSDSKHQKMFFCHKHSHTHNEKSGFGWEKCQPKQYLL